MPTLENQRGSVVMEIGDAVWTVAVGERVLEIPFERQANGRMTDVGRAEVSTRLRKFVTEGGGTHAPRALCAIGARGVSLRRIQLPPSRPEDFDKVLALQIEREFPLPPAQLAWGHLRIAPAAGHGSEIMIAAVKKEATEEYAGIISACGLNPHFTPGIFVVGRVVAGLSGELSVLNVGRFGTELAVFENGVPIAIRVLPWGTEQLRGALVERLGQDGQMATAWLDRLIRGELVPTDWPAEVQAAIQSATENLAGLLQRGSSSRRFWLAGEGARIIGFDRQLNRALGAAFHCEALPAGREQSPNSTLAALRRMGSSEAMAGLMELRVGGSNAVVQPVAQPVDLRWIKIAAALAIGFFALRYAGPMLRKPALERKLAVATAARAELPPIDRELDFLRAIEKNQPAYLSGLAVLAEATPRGTRLESLSLNGRGEFTFAATLQNPQQANEIRTKLIDSGIFTSAVIEEQTPTPDQRQVKIRLRARWNTSPEAKSAVLDRVSAATTTKTNPPPRGGPG